MKIYVGSFFQRTRASHWIDIFQEMCESHNIEFGGVIANIIPDIEDDDIYISWNLHMGQEKIGKLFKRHIIIENPYIKTEKKMASVGLFVHNSIDHALPCLDTGQRFQSFNREIYDWKKDGKYILIATQAKTLNGKSLGSEKYKQPAQWDVETIKMVKRNTTKPILFRQHPNGRQPHMYLNLKRAYPEIKMSFNKGEIEKDLNHTFATVVWASNSATDSLLHGVPVFYTGNTLFLKDLCKTDLKHINKPLYSGKRFEYFSHMAWNQYTIEEIKNGFFLSVIQEFYKY